MATEITPMTAAAFALIGRDEWRYELVRGELIRLSPAGLPHGKIASRLNRWLGQFIEDHGLGETFIGEASFLLSTSPDTVRCPDFSFVSQTRLQALGPLERIFPGAPDLAAEILSPNDRYPQVREKIVEYFSAGARIVMILDPRQESIAIHRSPTEQQVLSKPDTLTIPDMFPGWSVPVAKFFQ